jgi:hypothetical protein
LPPRSSPSASSVSSPDPSWPRTKSAATAPTVRQNQYLIGFHSIHCRTIWVLSWELGIGRLSTITKGRSNNYLSFL